jgi:ParB-like chromosome segregation protein Spo0J
VTSDVKTGELEYWTLDRLIPYANNAKIHSKDQVRKLAKLIASNGNRWTNPIQVQKGTGSIIAGHGRRLAAIELGLARVPVFVIDCTDEEARVMRLADNRVTSTDYDANLINIELSDLKGSGVDLELTGYDSEELDRLVNDFATLDPAMLTDDIGDAVDLQKENNAQHQEDADAALSPIAKAFGFTKIATAQVRRVKAFMAHIEQQTGQKGVEALMIHIDRSL